MRKKELYEAIENLPNWPTSKERLSKSLRAVLRELANVLDKNLDVFDISQNKIFVSKDYLSKKLECSKRDVARKIGELEPEPTRNPAPFMGGLAANRLSIHLGASFYPC